MLEYLNNNKIWVQLEGLTIKHNDSPTMIYQFNLDERTDSLDVVVFDVAGFNMLKPNTIVRIKERDQNNYTYWVTGDYSKDVRTNSSIHAIKLREPIELAKDYKVEPISFYPGRYTFKQLIIRINNISKFGFIFDDFNFELDSGWRNPRYSFNSMTLYNVLFDIGRSVDRVPEFVYNINDNLWELKFKRMDGIGQIEHDISIFDGALHKEEYINNGLTNSVYSEVKNLVGNEASVFPSEFFGVSAETFDENDTTLTAANAVIRLPENIKEIIDFRIFAYKVNNLDPISHNEYYVSLNQDNNFVNEYAGYNTQENFIVSEIRLIEKSEYEKLDDKKRYIPYEKGTNMIDLRNFEWGDGIVVRSVYWEPYQPDPSYYNVYGVITDIYKCFFSIKYIPVTADDLPLMESNNFEINRTVFYNQNETLVDSDKIADNLKNYAFNMSGKDLLKEGTFANWSDIPKIGENVRDLNGNRYVISNVAITVKFDKYDCVFQLNENHTRRSEFVGADTSFMLYNIPDNEIVNRLTLERDIIRLSINEEITNKATSRITPAGIKTYLNVLAGEDSGIPTYVAINFYSTGVNLQHIFDTMTILPSGTNISYSIKARDNRVYGRKLDKNITQLYTYTDELGECNYFDLKICQFPYAVGTNEFNEIVQNYPISSLALNASIDNNYVTANFPTYFYQKDAFERFNFTYQVSYKGARNTIVRKEFIKDLVQFDGGKYINRLAVAFLTENVGEYDSFPVNFVARKLEQLSVVTTGDKVYYEFSHSGYSGNIKALAIYDTVDAYLFPRVPYLIKNYFDGYSYSGDKLRIYLSFEKG